MEYKVLENLVNIKMKNFIDEYKNAAQLFENRDVKNGLLHPAEYGMYKEKLLSSLFEFTLPKKYSCGTGFVINNYKEITTQCDIILFDALNAPFLEIENGRFFPQEVVYAIGEVKSKLTKRQLFDALIKLAKNKKIRKPFKGNTTNDDAVDVDPLREQYHSICTFLICDEIIDWNDNISKEIRNEYTKNNIDVQYQFNLILSLKNGVIGYDVYKAIEDSRNNGEDLDDRFQQNGGHLGIASPYFKATQSQNITALDYMATKSSGEIDYLKYFIVLLNNFLIHLQSYYPDPVHYLYN